jgi:hypothetical protein
MIDHPMWRVFLTLAWSLSIVNAAITSALTGKKDASWHPIPKAYERPVFG